MRDIFICINNDLFMVNMITLFTCFRPKNSTLCSHWSGGSLLDYKIDNTNTTNSLPWGDMLMFKESARSTCFSNKQYKIKRFYHFSQSLILGENYIGH